MKFTKVGQTGCTNKNMAIKNIVLSLLILFAPRNSQLLEFDKHCEINSHEWNIYFTATNEEADFIRELLDGYDPRVFPSPENTSLVIHVSYYMTQLQGLVRLYIV